MSRARLDRELVARRLVASRSRAQRAIREGQVVVNGAPVVRPGYPVEAGAVIEVHDAVDRFVGYGGLKLDEALHHFDIEVAGRTAIDVGASTGGFTDGNSTPAAGVIQGCLPSRGP